MARPSEDKNKQLNRREFLGKILTGILLIGGVDRIVFQDPRVAAAQPAPEEDVPIAGGPAALEARGALFPLEIASLGKDLVIANFGLVHGLNIDDANRDRLDQTISTIKDQYQLQSRIWKPVRVESYDHFSQLADFTPSQRMRVPEAIRLLEDGRTGEGGSQTYAFNDITDLGDSLRIRICFAGDQTEQVFSGQFYPGDESAPLRKARASLDTSRFIAAVLNFNTSNTLRWPRLQDSSELDFSPAAASLFTTPFTQII